MKNISTPVLDAESLERWLHYWTIELADNPQQTHRLKQRHKAYCAALALYDQIEAKNQC